MNRLVRLVGSGIGLTSEAIHAARSRSSSEQPSSSSRNTSEACPEYVEVADEATADALVRSGQAEQVSDGKAKKSKAAEAGYESDSYSSDDEDQDREPEEDDAAWELDDMAERVRPPTYDESQAAVAADESENVKAKREDEMIRGLLQIAGPPPLPTRQIPCPVIIPQRRPGKRDRGFVRAYAPVLEECGVSQDVFLKFIEDFDKASKASPWIDVVFVAAGIAGFAPSIAAQVVTRVAQVAAGTARELQSRHRKNSFLDRVNQELLMPRGLYAMVMAFKEDIPNQRRGPLSKLTSTLGNSLFSSEKLDINQTITKYSKPDPEMSKLKKGMQDIRLTSGKTHGQLELPESAPLVYPDLDRVAAQALEANSQGKGKEPAGTRDKFKSAGTWVQDYYDRRGQAWYEAQHQGSSLAVPSAERAGFKSRYNDPNHPANNGSLISLITGGAISSTPRQRRRAARQERRGARREYRDEARVARGRAPRGPRRQRAPRGQRQRGIRRLLQENVLYLLIVNLPSDQEVAESVVELERIVDQAAMPMS